MLKVHFENVGCGKKCWSGECHEIELEAWVLKQVRRGGALLSRDIEFEIHGNEGTIFAGMRAVGTIRVEDLDPAPQEAPL